MRKPRSLILEPEQANVHSIFRCHNRTKMLENNENKDLLLSCIKESLQNCKYIKNKLKIHAYCVMDNHFHHLIYYENGHETISKYLHHSHTLFGIRYNRKNKKTGKFAEDRPKTCLIENHDHALRVHFYVEANPLLAGKYKNLKQLRNDQFNSYSFYAFGIQTKFSEILTIPDWYLQLGPDEETRQLQYRKLFASYLIEMGLNTVEKMDKESMNLADRLVCNTEFLGLSQNKIKIESCRMLSFYIGNLNWRLVRMKKLKALRKKNQRNSVKNKQN